MRLQVAVLKGERGRGGGSEGGVWVWGSAVSGSSGSEAKDRWFLVR